MNTAIKRAGWLVAALGWTLGAGMPAVADDTELFSGPAPSGSLGQPNVLFILDTSGSMDTDVETPAPYDKDFVYAGNCEKDYIYYTKGNNIWNCNDTNPKINGFPATNNHCQDSWAQIDSIGIWLGKILQWDSNNSKWREPKDLFGGNEVDCEPDQGTHGKTGNPEPWAVDDGMYSYDNSNQAKYMGNHTIFHGNWLNWYRGGGPTIQKPRLDVVNDVMDLNLTLVKNVNVGLMRFNREEGGPVVYAMEDVATARTPMQAMIDSFQADGWTPLAETMFEAVSYYMGRSVDYGDGFEIASVDPSRVGGVPTSTQYLNPIVQECQKSFIVYMTDGAPTRDLGAESRVASLPGFDTTVGTTCDNSGDHGTCLPELAEYGFKHDASSLPDFQNIITHTIGFTIDLPILATTAKRGGGRYYLADDSAGLYAALTQIILEVIDDAQNFTAPSVPVNAFNRTQNLSDVFVSVFQPSATVHWPGNMKKYKLTNRELVGQDGINAINPTTGFFTDTAHSFWSTAVDGGDAPAGGAAEFLPGQNSRNVYTNIAGGDLNSTSNAVKTNNGSVTAAMIGAPSTDRDDVIDWVRGKDIFDVDADGSTTDEHNQFGDPLHVRPTPVIYGGSAAAPDMVVYVSTNDGMMHAIDPDNGSELWSFIPERLLDRLYDLYTDTLSPQRQYGLDGEISIHIQNDDGLPGISGAERVLMFFGMRRGGYSLFAMDVTDRNDPQVEWILDDTDPDFADLGETWSKPVITKVDINGTKKLVAIFGGGYHTSQDFTNATDSGGNAVYMVDALTGALLWSAGNHPGHDLKLNDLDYSIPATLKVLDLNLDGLADRMYVGDMGGQVWRFDIFNGEPVSKLVEGGTLATLGRRAAGFGDTDDGLDPTHNRRFYATPDTVPVVTNTSVYLTVNLGSGYRAHPNDVTSTENDFFSVRDFNVFNQLKSNDPSYSTPILRTDLVDITADVTTPVDPNAPGWRLRMVESAGEKVLSPSNTFENTVYFTSFAPGAIANACVGQGGLNRLYAVDVRTGAPTHDYDTTVNDPLLDEDDRFKQLAQVGIAPEPVLLFPEDAPNEPIMCVGVECDDAGVTNTAQLTFWTQDGSQ